MPQLDCPVVVILLAVLCTACQQQDTGYLPLADAPTLTYALTQVRSGETYHQKILTTFQGPLTVAGETVYRQVTASGPLRLLQSRPEGIMEIAAFEAGEPVSLPAPILLLPQPLQRGDRWQSLLTTHLLEWRKHSLEKAGRGLKRTLQAEFLCETLDETVTTPAGRFDGVARVKAEASEILEYGSLQERAVIRIELTRWYAPGIGLIKSERREYAESRELNPGEASMVLERIN